MKRFWDKTAQRDNGCLEWTGGLSNGYGAFNYGGQNIRAHVVAYKLYHGKWAANFVCHTCDNRKCVAKDHLYDGTAKENTQDAVRQNKMGRKNNLTWHERNLVRLALSDRRLTQREIAAIFNIGQATVRECKFFLHESKLEAR